MVRKMTPSRQALEALEEARSQVGRLRRCVRSLRERCGPMVSKWEPRSGSISDGHPQLWDSLAEQSIILEREEEKLRRMEARMEQWIDLLPKPRWRMVLRCHYLDGMPLSDIARELTDNTGREFSMNQVYRFHRQALDAADELWPLS